MAKAVTRGVANRNPGNIRKTKDRWQGLSREQPDGSFFQFETPVWGIRAIARILITYQDKYDLVTVRDLISRWAPPADMNDTDAYVANVCRWSGLSPDEPVSMSNYAHLRAVVTGIIRQENGTQPYTDMQIDEALKLAGVVKKEPNSVMLTAARDPKIIATTIAGTAAAAQATISSVSGIWDDLSRMIDPRIIVWSLVGVGLLVLASFVYEKYRKRKQGII